MTKSLFINDSDYIKLENFSLSYRFTDNNFDILPKNHLSTIKPLPTSKAEEIHEYSKKFIDGKTLSSKNFSKTKLIKTDASDPLKIGSILHSLFENSEIILSYDNKTALVTTYNTFYKYWDSFCYPSSDDIVIFPLDEEWVMAYFHYEEFVVNYN
ncbi:MAG: hypothetical protein R3D71_07990 [Rickettsiales bacterium]